MITADSDIPGSMGKAFRNAFGVVEENKSAAIGHLSEQLENSVLYAPETR